MYLRKRHSSQMLLFPVVVGAVRCTSHLFPLRCVLLVTLGIVCPRRL